MTVMTAGCPDVAAGDVLATLKTHILVDGFQLVYDAHASRGSYFHDAATGKEYLDFYAFFASQPIGYNHPRMREAEFQGRLLTAASTKVANSDVYTRAYANLVKTIEELAGLGDLNHYFFIDGGALGIENALKAAFDWKVRKNLAAGRGELGTRVIHFRQCFHGRTGYTMSLTDPWDPRKVQYYPKFDWPRIDNPKLDFALQEPERTADVASREKQALRQIEEAVERHPHDIAAMIIEPIQGEGGDNHFRGEFLRALRDVSDRHDIILIFDEVQTGVGLTGRMWCCEHFDVTPDVLCFGKKMQVCGLMAGPRLDEVDSVFKIPSRINSTWGGNIADFVRCTQYLRIIHDEGLVERAAETGDHLLEQLTRLARQHRVMSAVRGRGLMCAFDLPDTATRDSVRRKLYERQMLVLASGEKSIRFRPVLDISTADIDRGAEILGDVLSELG
jgi:L-lysine 6-transaminase